MHIYSERVLDFTGSRWGFSFICNCIPFFANINFTNIAIRFALQCKYNVSVAGVFA